MNILLINHYAGAPGMGMEYRPFYLAREWVRAGHSVTIVAASFCHTRHLNPTVHGAVTHEDMQGIHYVWLKTPNYHGNGIGRILNMLAFILRLYRHLPGLTRDWRPDVVIASSTYPLDFFPARRIARTCGARLVFELHDLWPLSPLELGAMSRHHPFIRLMQYAEDTWCRNCDLAVSILPHADQHLQTRGLDLDKFVHVPNGIDLAEWTEAPQPLPPEHQEFLRRQHGKGRFLVGYAGAYGVANALDALVRAAEYLRNDPIEIVLVGTGPEREKLAALAGTLGLANVTFLASVPKSAIPNWLRQLDCLFIGLQRRPLYLYGVSPNKLFDYMMSGKPIVYAASAGNDPVMEAGCGVSVVAEDPRAIAEGIRDLYRLTPERRQTMGEAGRTFILAKHTYPVLANRFLAALKGAGHA